VTHAWRYDDDPKAEPDTDTIPPVPPTDEDVRSARSAVHDAVVAEQAQAQELPRAVKRLAEHAGARVARRIGLVGAVLAILASTAVSIAAYQQAESTESTVSAALDQLATANSTLQSRGQAPVRAPVDADPSQAITAAVLAQVLTQLPDAPSADQVAAAITPAVTANVLGPSMGRLSELVAEYLRVNPPRAGPPPSQADIDASVARRLAENPPRDGAMGDRGADGERGATGDTGPAGQDGRSILTGPEPVRLADGSCVWRSTYDRAPTVQEYPAGTAACPDPVTSPEPDEAVEGTSQQSRFAFPLNLPISYLRR
jgi:hypothetical protein